jgi:hypothetical protein
MTRGKWRLVGLGLLVALMASLAPLSLQAATSYPKIINLPNAWLPEGVAIGSGPLIYAGSRANGAVYAADLRTGEGAIVVPPQSGRIAVGLKIDPRSNVLFVAGGPGGAGYAYDAASGADLGSYRFVSDGGPTFVNDVVITRDAAYFTDSQRPVLYKVALGPGGSLPASDSFSIIPLSGDYQQVPGFNVNGIAASANGKALVLVHSTLGLLYKVDPNTGVAATIDLAGASVSAGDGILLEGKTLYVVRNRLNQIAVIKLAPDLLSGEVTAAIGDPSFDVPTTVAAFGNGLYAVNARFGTPNTPETTYTIVRVEP